LVGCLLSGGAPNFGPVPCIDHDGDWREGRLMRCEDCPAARCTLREARKS